MNWLKYKQKYFFDGVKNYDEIDKALLFPSDYSEIAELFQKITSTIILSGDYSDDNIDQICSDEYDSIAEEPLLKSKFLDAWTSFNQTLGVGVKKLKKSAWKQNDVISNLTQQFYIKDQPKTLTAEEYGLAGHYVISSLEKLGFPFEMAAEINRILLEDYSIKLPNNVPSKEFERKKWSKLYQNRLDNKKYVHSSKIKSIPRDGLVSNTKRRRSLINYIHNYMNNNPMVKSITELNAISSQRLLQASSQISEEVSTRQSVREPLQISKLVSPDGSKRPSAINSILNSSAHDQESENNTNNDVPNRSVSENIFKRNIGQIILLGNNQINNTEYKDQLERLNYFDQIPKNEIIHNRFQVTHPVGEQDISSDQPSLHSNGLTQLFQSSLYNSSVSQTNSTISSNHLSDDGTTSTSTSIFEPK